MIVYKKFMFYLKTYKYWYKIKELKLMIVYKKLMFYLKTYT